MRYRTVKFLDTDLDEKMMIEVKNAARIDMETLEEIDLNLDKEKKPKRNM